MKLFLGLRGGVRVNLFVSIQWLNSLGNLCFLLLFYSFEDYFERLWNLTPTSLLSYLWLFLGLIIKSGDKKFRLSLATGLLVWNSILWIATCFVIILSLSEKTLYLLFLDALEGDREPFYCLDGYLALITKLFDRLFIYSFKWAFSFEFKTSSTLKNFFFDLWLFLYFSFELNTIILYYFLPNKQFNNV